MKERVARQNSKRHTYYIISNGFLSLVYNFDIDRKFKDCIYVIKLGSNVNPKIFYSEKKDNVWVKKRKFIGDYFSLMDFVCENESKIICVRGFSRAVMGGFMSILNKSKGMNIRPIKYANDVERANYFRHSITEKDNIKKLQRKLEIIDKEY